MVESRRFWIWIVVAALILLALLSLTRGPLRRPAPAPGIPGQQTPVQPAPGEQLQPGLPAPGERVPVAPGM